MATGGPALLGGKKTKVGQDDGIGVILLTVFFGEALGEVQFGGMMRFADGGLGADWEGAEQMPARFLTVVMMLIAWGSG